MVDLKANPYYLSEEDCKWVENTIANMTDEEKVGQLFFQLTHSLEEEHLKELVEKYHLGGCRYNPAPGKAIQKQNQILQKYSKIPLIIACNTEAGGDGACSDGTPIASEIKIAAAGKRNMHLLWARWQMKKPPLLAVTWHLHQFLILLITGRTQKSFHALLAMTPNV